MANHEVLLLKPVDGLGAEGDQVKVRAGYARNFLLPQGMAVPLTVANRKQVESLKRARGLREARELDGAQALAKQIEKAGIAIAVKTGEGGKLFGAVRATTSTPEKRDHFPKLVSFDQVRDDVYQSNIQIAELNMLNAAMAVIKWKKLWGIYHDVEGEFDSTYTINTNQLLGDDAV